MMQRFCEKRLHQEDDPGPDTALDETPPRPVQWESGRPVGPLRTSAEIGGCQSAFPPRHFRWRDAVFRCRTVELVGGGHGGVL